MRATAEPLDANKVRLSVEVDAAEVDQAVDEMVRSLTRQARIPGFRPGKVPRRVLEARMGGRGAIRGEALREAIPDFYARAVVDADVDPITQPEIDVKAGEEDGDLEFEALVEVRPTVSVPGYVGLQVTVPSPGVTQEEVSAQVDRLRETDAQLEPVERSAVDGDNVTIDLHGTSEGEEIPSATDLLYEIGSGSMLPGLDEHLRGSSAGDIVAFESELPGGQTIAARALVKKVQRKVLPELTDEWVEESSDADTVEELQADLRRRLERSKLLQIRMAIREETMQALADLVEDDVVPDALVDLEVRDRLADLQQRLESRGAGLEELLAATGRSAEDLVNGLQQEARPAVKVDLALRAVAAAEGMEITEEELTTELETTAERLGVTAAELRHQLEHNGRMGTVRAEQLKAKAMSWLLDHVELVDEEGHPVAREDLELDAEELATDLEALDLDDDDLDDDDLDDEDLDDEQPVASAEPVAHGTVTGRTEEGS